MKERNIKSRSRGGGGGGKTMKDKSYKVIQTEGTNEYIISKRKRVKKCHKMKTIKWAKPTQIDGKIKRDRNKNCKKEDRNREQMHNLYKKKTKKKKDGSKEEGRKGGIGREEE